MRFSNVTLLLAISLVLALAGEGRAQSASATFLRVDTGSQGNWHGLYGSDGYSISGGSADLPSYATFSVRDQQDTLWEPATKDVRALQTADATARLANCWSSRTTFSMDVNLIDGRSHQFAMYLIDWDRKGRVEQVQIVDPAAGAVLDTETLSGFADGLYVAWNLSGRVRIDIKRTAGPNAAVSGVFFDKLSTIPAKASFVRADADTGGNWRGAYGADGHVIAGDSETLPAYGSFAAENGRVWTGQTDAGDASALASGTGPGRIASDWRDDSELSLGLTIGDEIPREVALYAVDRDGLGREERVEVLDARTGAVLDAQLLSSFDKGVYLVWKMSGQVRIKITRTAGPNAVVSAIFFGENHDVASSAVFLRADVATQGNWRASYGADGYAMAGDTQSIPAYALFNAGNQASHTWDSGADDPRALQRMNGGRIAAMWHGEAGLPFDLSLNLVDGKHHQFAVYLLDWDIQGRSEQVQILDAASEAVLDAENVPDSTKGLYLVWNLSGHVKIRITGASGQSAVVSGVFFGGDGSVHSSVTFLRLDKTTRGDWQSGYGAEGHAFANGEQSFPKYAILAGPTQPTVAWKAADDPGALRAPKGSARIGTAWCGAPALDFDLSLTDDSPHKVALYALDYDHRGRAEVVQILDADTDTVLDTRAIAGFREGTYVVWRLSGHVRINVTVSEGPNACAEGLLLGDGSGVSATGAFIRQDSRTGGNWQGKYGSGGYVIANDARKLPADTSLDMQNRETWTGAVNSADIRTLRSGNGSGRIASAWYNNPGLELDVNITGTPRQLALYAVDWEGLGRKEVVQLLDAGTGKVLDSRTLSDFARGVWLVWTISGHVRITISRTKGPNAVVSGVFFDGNAAPEQRPQAAAPPSSSP